MLFDILSQDIDNISLQYSPEWLMVCFPITIIASNRLGLISMCLIIDTVAVLWKPYYTVRLSRLSTGRYFD